MVADTDTLVDPLTVVVLAIDAFITNIAMLRIPRFQDLASRAQEKRFKVLVEL